MGPLARKEKEEERKKALPPIQLARGAQGAKDFAMGGFGGLGRGAGSGGFGGLSAATLGGKIAVAVLLATLGVGAFGVGRVMAPREAAFSAGRGVGVDRNVERSKYSGDLKGLPSENNRGSAIQIIPESTGGKSAAELAAEAEAAAKAEAERKAREDAANAQQAPDAQAKVETVVPMVVPKVNDEAKKSPFTKKFGELTKQLGGLNGGAGLSGGVGRQFSAEKVGNARGFGSRVTTPTRATSKAPARASRGRAFKQLVSANNLSRSGARAGGETGSTLADQAFSGGIGGGSVITGDGARAPITGAGTQTGGQPTEGKEGGSEGTEEPEEAKKKDSSPWKMAAIAGAAALAMGGILLMIGQQIASQARKMMKAPEPATQAAGAQLLQTAQMVLMLAAACGAAAAGVGAMLIGMKQKMYGMMFIGGGAGIAALAIMALMSDEKDAKAESAAEVTKGAQAAQLQGTPSSLHTPQVSPQKVTGMGYIGGLY